MKLKVTNVSDLFKNDPNATRAVNSSTTQNICNTDIWTSNVSWDWNKFDWSMYGPQYVYYGYQNQFAKSVNGDVCTFSIDVPGVKPENVQLEIKEGLLTLKTTRKDTSYVQIQSIYVDDNWNLDSADAELEYGVLTVKFTRKPDRKSRSIKVNVK